MTSPTTTLTSNDDDSSEVSTDAATKNAASSRSRFPFIAGLLVAVIGLAFLVGGVVGWFTVKAELEDEHVTVSEDAEVLLQSWGQSIRIGPHGHFLR